MRPVGRPRRGQRGSGPLQGEKLIELVAYHHAIGILNALVLAPIGALIVVGDRRHLLAWLLLVESLALATLNCTEQYAALALGLAPRRLSLPGGDLASWLASWTNLPGIVISVVALVLRFRRAGAVQRQQIKWFAFGVALSIPLGLFPQAEPWGPYLELGGGRSTVAVHVSTVRVEDRPDEINQGLERTLGSVKRLVEKAGAAGT